MREHACDTYGAHDSPFASVQTPLVRATGSTLLSTEPSLNGYLPGARSGQLEAFGSFVALPQVWPVQPELVQCRARSNVDARPALVLKALRK